MEKNDRRNRLAAAGEPPEARANVSAWEQKVNSQGWNVIEWLKYTDKEREEGWGGAAGGD